MGDLVQLLGLDELHRGDWAALGFCVFLALLYPAACIIHDWIRRRDGAG